jgi:anti-anti-sigma factor
MAMMSDREHPLVIDARVEADQVVLILTGELDPHTAPSLRQALDRTVGDTTTVVVFDLGGVTFVDSSGLRVIIAAHKLMDDRHGRLVLRDPSDTTRRILDITGLSDRIEVEAGPPRAGGDGGVA